MQAMDRVNLVIDIVFNNEQAFGCISTDDAIKVLLICKNAALNQNIIKAQIKRQVYIIHDRLYHTIEDGCYLIHYASNENQLVRADAIFQEADNIVNEIVAICKLNSTFRDYMSNFVMAEYKEGIYYMFNSSFATTLTDFIFRTCEKYFIHKLALCDPETHLHNPDHCIFEQRKYAFYDEIEKNNICILKLKKVYEMDDDEYGSDDE
jgi:hypothetical protein